MKIIFLLHSIIEGKISQSTKIAWCYLQMLLQMLYKRLDNNGLMQRIHNNWTPELTSMTDFWILQKERYGLTSMTKQKVGFWHQNQTIDLLSTRLSTCSTCCRTCFIINHRMVLVPSPQLTAWPGCPSFVTIILVIPAEAVRVGRVDRD